MPQGKKRDARHFAQVNGRVIQKLWTKDEWSKAASEALAQKPTPQKPAGKKLRELLIRGRQAHKEADWLARQLAAQSGRSVVYWRKLAHRAVEGE